MTRVVKGRGQTGETEPDSWLDTAWEEPGRVKVDPAWMPTNLWYRNCYCAGESGARFGGMIISVWRGSVGSWKLTGASEDGAREVLALGSYSTLKYLGIEKITEEMVRKSILKGNGGKGIWALFWKSNGAHIFHWNKLTVLSEQGRSERDRGCTNKGSTRETFTVHQIVRRAFTFIFVQIIPTKLILVDQIKFVCKIRVVYKKTLFSFQLYLE